MGFATRLPRLFVIERFRKEEQRRGKREGNLQRCLGKVRIRGWQWKVIGGRPMGRRCADVPILG